MIKIIICVFLISINAQHKNILIIGGSKGIGKSLVNLYSKNGYKVYATFNNTY